MPVPEGAVLRDSGEAAFVVEFGDTIDEAHGAKVAALAAALEAAAPDGLTEVVPTFRSVLVLFDPDAVTREALVDAMPASLESIERGEGATWSVPACLDGAVAEDAEEAARGLAITAGELAERFLAATYRVGMYGFAPGTAYLSGLDDALAIARRATPRPPVQKNAIIIAGGMAGIMSVAMPTGWYVIGRVAVRMFDAAADPMVPFAVGDRLTFRGVSERTLAELADSPSGGVERT